MSTSSEFRQALVQNLKQGLVGFDMARLRKQYAVSDDDARKAARDIYYSQCLKAADDWTITDAERQVLRRLGERLELSEIHQNECLAAAKNRVFETELKEAMRDEGISSTEANALAHLRKSLGLAPMTAEEFGPPQPRPQKRRERSPKQKANVRRKPRQAEWEGSWGPRSAVLGIPYTVLVLSFLGCGVVGACTAYAHHSWWPLLASPVAALLLIGGSFLGSYCGNCGGTWCVSRVGSETDYSFFSGRTTYVHYECEKCGAQSVRRHRSHR